MSPRHSRLRGRGLYRPAPQYARDFIPRASPAPAARGRAAAPLAKSFISVHLFPEVCFARCRKQKTFTGRPTGPAGGFPVQ